MSKRFLNLMIEYHVSTHTVRKSTLIEKSSTKAHAAR